MSQLPRSPREGCGAFAALAVPAAAIVRRGSPHQRCGDVVVGTAGQLHRDLEQTSMLLSSRVNAGIRDTETREGMTRIRVLKRRPARLATGPRRAALSAPVMGVGRLEAGDTATVGGRRVTQRPCARRATSVAAYVPRLLSLARCARLALGGRLLTPASRSAAGPWWTSAASSSDVTETCTGPRRSWPGIAGLGASTPGRGRPPGAALPRRIHRISRQHGQALAGPSFSDDIPGA